MTATVHTAMRQGGHNTYGAYGAYDAYVPALEHLNCHLGPFFCSRSGLQRSRPWFLHELGVWHTSMGVKLAVNVFSHHFDFRDLVSAFWGFIEACAP